MTSLTNPFLLYVPLKQSIEEEEPILNRLALSALCLQNLFQVGILINIVYVKYQLLTISSIYFNCELLFTNIFIVLKLLKK